jgi:UDP-glucose 4-epimerase
MSQTAPNSEARGCAWVTGAHGFIGRHLSRHLTTSGYRVYGLGHGPWPASEAQAWGVADWTNGDVSASNLEHMRQKLGAPQVIFHLAGGSSVGLAITHPYEDFRRTVGSTAELLEWMRQHARDSRLVAVSSAAVYGSNHGGAIAETDTISPFSPYGTHKFVMEELCRSYAANFGLCIAIPRLFSVYGTWLKKQLLWDLCGKLQAGGQVELGGSGNELRDWIDVRDVARGLECVARSASSQVPVVNLGFGMGTSVRDIARIVIANWLRVEQQSALIRFNGRSRAGDPFSLVANVDNCKSLGLTPSIEVEQGIADYVDWYCAQAKGRG